MPQDEELRIWNAFKQVAPTALTGHNEEDPLDKDRANKFRKPDGKGETRGSEKGADSRRDRVKANSAAISNPEEAGSGAQITGVMAIGRNRGRRSIFRR